MTYEQVDILISFDTTGSMYSCLNEVRRRMSEVVNHLFTKFPDLRIGVITHGNLEDVPSLEQFEFSNNRDDLVNFIKTVPPKSGGGVYHNGIGNPANYELVLFLANSWYWRPDAKKYMIMLGDVDAHKVGERSRRNNIECTIDWETELDTVASNGIKIFAVQCLHNPNADFFWNYLAKRTDGKRIELHQLSQIVELLTLAVYVAHDKEIAEEYASTLQLNRGFQQIAYQLLGNTNFNTFNQQRADGLEPVPPYRFQKLHVDSQMSIKDFVNQSNLGERYKAGRGFYQLSKTETIQKRKEVILVDKVTGDMFSGSEARNLIGLPFGVEGRINPRSLPTRGDWDVFVQSTSYNRVLMPRTEFLYEVNR